MTRFHQIEQRHAQQERQRQFGLFVQKARLAAGLKQGDLANQSQITVQRLSRIERGHARPRPAEVKSITLALAHAAGAEVRASA